MLSRGRGENKSPGEFRRSQNWIGGTRPGNARFVPPPPHRVEEAMAEGVPVVALATGRAREDVSCVRIDDFSAAREMTAHLIAQGHTINDVNRRSARRFRGD